MSKLRSRTAVSPLRRVALQSGNLGIAEAASVDGLTAALAPQEPLYCVRPATLRATARRFVTGFAGDVLYAVKCNPEPSVLRALWRGGVRHFDCASPAEIRLVRQLFPAAAIHYMHPIKPAPAIGEAYRDFGVRSFSLDSVEEIEKIRRATGDAADLGLFIRLALPKGNSMFDLSGKFGAGPAEAVRLLRLARPLSATLGLCFHVGSQCLDPDAYGRAIELAGRVVADAGVALDALDVGGGFAVSYPGETPPALGRYFEAIEAAVALGFPAGAPRLLCEPGRAMVASGASVVVRVEARRGDILHINDGAYGTLADCGVPRLKLPARLIRPAGASLAAEAGFSFYGPTCDSADFMAGPFLLPADIQAGDWIELGQVGAYGTCLRTAFNGFDRVWMAEVADPPMLATPGLDDFSTVGSRLDDGTPNDNRRPIGARPVSRRRIAA